MRSVLILASLIAASSTAAAPPREGGQKRGCTGPESSTRLHVTVENIRSSEGLIAVTVYPDDPNRFLVSHGSLLVGRVRAKAPVTKVCVHVPHPGTYAIAVYHDADGSRKLTRSGLGLPAEGYGFANNPPAAFALPMFSRVRLAVPRTDTETRIRLIYP